MIGAVRDELGPLAALWEWFAVSACHGYSPLYERIAASVAADPEILELVREAPPGAHLPPALLGAVHYVLLDGFEHPLADVYAGRSDADPVPLFAEVCRLRRHDIARLLATRTVQTNDCGRSAVIGPALTWLAARLRRPLALVDVGTSAGLNLLCHRYRLDYGPLGATGPADSTVHVPCTVVAGRPPIAPELPPLAARVGIDRSPIDVTDPSDARWLLACVWPDTGRMGRTRAAIELARRDPPDVRTGDAVEALPAVLGELPEGSAAVVTTTWAYSYFSLDQRSAFQDLLAAEARRRPLAWLVADGAGVVPDFDGVAAPDDDGTEADVLGTVLFDPDPGPARLLGLVRHHGQWLDWRAPAP